MVLPYVRKQDLHKLWQVLGEHGLADANIGLITDIISCPGLDYCNLANARAIPIAQRLSRHFSDPALQSEIGPITLNISGCINACGHHHVGNIGILGVDKKGVEHYQITIGGIADENAAIGKILGPSFPAEGVVDAIDSLIGTFRNIRTEGETFIDTVSRVGITPFKETLYANH